MAFRYCLPERGVASLKRCGDTLDTVRLKWSCYKHSGRLQICFVLLRRCKGVHAGRVLLSLVLVTLCTCQGSRLCSCTAASAGSLLRTFSGWLCLSCLVWLHCSGWHMESQVVFCIFSRFGILHNVGGSTLCKVLHCTRKTGKRL